MDCGWTRRRAARLRKKYEEKKKVYKEYIGKDRRTMPKRYSFCGLFHSGWNELSCCQKPPLKGKVAVPLGTDGEVHGAGGLTRFTTALQSRIDVA